MEKSELVKKILKVTDLILIPTSFFRQGRAYIKYQEKNNDWSSENKKGEPFFYAMMGVGEISRLIIYVGIYGEFFQNFSDNLNFKYPKLLVK